MPVLTLSFGAHDEAGPPRRHPGGGDVRALCFVLCCNGALRRKNGGGLGTKSEKKKNTIASIALIFTFTGPGEKELLRPGVEGWSFAAKQHK